VVSCPLLEQNSLNSFFDIWNIRSSILSLCSCTGCVRLCSCCHDLFYHLPCWIH
jgi:hypothetical protein